MINLFDTAFAAPLQTAAVVMGEPVSIGGKNVQAVVQEIQRGENAGVAGPGKESASLGLWVAATDAAGLTLARNTLVVLVGRNGARFRIARHVDLGAQGVDIYLEDAPTIGDIMEGEG